MTSTCLICCVVDNNSKLIQANPEFYDALGYEESYFENHTILDILGDDSNWPDFNDIDRASQNTISATIKFYSNEGIPVYLKCNFGFRKHLIYVAGVDVSVDIFLHKNNKTISEIANLGAWSYIPAKDKFQHTEFFRELYGFSKDDTIDNKALYESVQRDSREVIDHALKNLYENHEPYDVEIKVSLKNGETAWLRVMAAPEVHKGEVTAINGVTQNITKYKELNLSLKETKRNQELAFRAIKSAYFTFNLKTQESESGDSFTALSNFP
ncbi:PAS domain S-box protein [Nonlabens sp. Hel1_33_55]|uniref:PAS domain S-box protein n=1 Tax=Nonlabens sp. Hel1_33_55 TaxID=1336802 RepID=UPI001560CBB4|nr:PAS domain S-box protein [Nonlabens sp. Hel1_33_55]